MSSQHDLRGRLATVTTGSIAPPAQPVVRVDAVALDTAGCLHRTDATSIHFFVDAAKLEVADAHWEILLANTMPSPTDSITIHAPQTEPPHWGELLLCLFVPPERQQERLGCLVERFHNWEQRFGTRTARRLYIMHALRSPWDIVKIGAFGALMDRFFHWISH